MPIVEFTASDAKAKDGNRNPRRLVLKRNKRYGFQASISPKDVPSWAKTPQRIYLDRDALTDLRDAINEFLEER